MSVLVKFMVNVGVFDPEIGAKIDNARAGGQKRLGKFGGEPVRQREKDNAGLTRDLFYVRIGKLQRGGSFGMSEARKNFGKRLSGELARRCCDKIDMWMAEKQADELFAGVTGGANNRDFGLRHKPMRISSRADCNELSCDD